MLTQKESLVDDYASPQEMWDYTFGDDNSTHSQGTPPAFGESVLPPFLLRQRVAAGPLNYYQENAINAALEAIASGSRESF